MGTKLTREPLVQFGKDGATANFGVFGTLATGTKVTSKTIATLQGNAAWLEGWQDAVIANKRPAYQDFNGLQYVHSYMMCYMFQTGVPEWYATTEYFIGSIVNDGTGVLYKSIQDNNTNHATSDGAWWSAVVTTFTPTKANALSGSIINSVVSPVSSVLTGTALIPLDDTIPQQSGPEGWQVTTLTITPDNASNTLEFSGLLMVAPNGSSTVSAVIYQDSNADAIWASGATNITAGEIGIIPVKFSMPAGTTSATTFKLWVGQKDAGTLTVNGISAGRLFGAIAKSFFGVKEIKA